MASSPDRGKSDSLTYDELAVGDAVEVYVLDGEIGWQWERREVVAIDRGGHEDAAPRHIVRFRDGDREYDIDVMTARGDRLMRRPQRTFRMRVAFEVPTQVVEVRAASLKDAWERRQELVRGAQPRGCKRRALDVEEVGDAE